MAKLKFISIIKEGSGRMQDVVFSKWKNTHIMRPYSKPTGPASPKQLEIHEAFSKLIKDWKRVSGILHKSWDAYAEARELNMTGYNAFISRNVNLQRAGKPLELFKPLGEEEIVDFTPSPGPNPGEISLTFTPANGGRHLTVFSQIKEEGRASGPLTRHDAGADAPSPYLVTGLESGREYHLYAVLTDAPYETAARVSASTGGAGMAG